MKYGKIIAAATALSTAVLFGQQEKLARELGKPIFAGAARSTWDSVYAQLVRLDAAADQAWRDLKTRRQYDAYRRGLHAKFIAAMGGFPERTPLNAKVVSTVRKERYRVEKVIFESMPGIHVTANFFVPAGTASLYRTVEVVAETLGTKDAYTLIFSPGPHGWTESTMTASADWMVAHLLGRGDLLPLDMPTYRALDLDLKYTGTDTGLRKEERGVPTASVDGTKTKPRHNNARHNESQST